MSEKFGQIILNSIISGGIYSLVAVGYSIVYGILNFINFAHGEICMVGAFLFYFFIVIIGINFFPAFILTVIIIVFLGIFIEKIAYRPLRNSPNIVPLISAIGVSILLQNLIALISTHESKSLGNPFFSKQVFEVFGLYISNIQLFIIFVSISLMLILMIFLKKGKWGKAMRAVSENMVASTAIGIDVNKIIILAFGIGSGLGAIAGICIGLEQDIEPLMGVLLGFKAFTASVIGGIGSLHGAIIGGFIIAAIENFSAGYISTQYKEAITFVVLIFVLLIRPKGIFINKQSWIIK